MTCKQKLEEVKRSNELLRAELANLRKLTANLTKMLREKIGRDSPICKN